MATDSETRRAEAQKHGNWSDLLKQGVSTGIIVTVVFLIGRFTDPINDELKLQRESMKDLEKSFNALAVKQVVTEQSVKSLNEKFDWFVAGQRSGIAGSKEK